MESIVKPLSYPKVGLLEYLLIAHPDAIVNEKVMAEKNAFTDDYQHKIAAKTQPHITVANFLAREAMEETIIRYAQRVCSQQSSFEVALNNYSGFPPHTIYLRVQDPQPFKQLVKELKVISNYVDSCSCPPVKLVSNPHVSFARHLSEEVYSKAIMDYSKRTFHETFMVDELVLLRRINPYDDCKTVHVFRLQPPGLIPFRNTLFNQPFNNRS